jgi:hypothetical protein
MSEVRGQVTGMTIVIAVLLAIFDPSTAELADGAYRMAPTYLTPTTALEHAAAARLAARAYHVDPALLLSIAWHESRFSSTEATPEVGGRVSCGAMTPEPIARCPRDGIIGGYLRGARHLAGWIKAMRGDLHTGLTGYAGGYALIDLCAAGGDVRGCHVADVFLDRAAMIRARRPTT